jgi:hypothetical protein
MRKAALVSLVVLAIAVPALAQVNHGDFLGTGVDFLQVTETTQTAGDPAVLWGAPALAGGGDQLLFFPPDFTSTCAAGTSDATNSTLTTTIVAQPGGSIDEITLVETGDVTLTKFPAFGDDTTNATASLSGSVEVTEVNGVPIASVLIFFSGTIAPKATFELPGDFGASLWSGSMSVDVATPVPNATKAILTLNNNLDSNCGAGATSAKIQKKTVSGPSVAIMINEDTCDIEIEKTCCIPQPPLVNGSICDGKAVRAVFEVVGGDCGDTTNTQGGEAKCSGPNPIVFPTDTVSVEFRKSMDAAVMSVTPDTALAVGDTFEILSTSGPTLKNQLKLLISGPGGTQNQEVHVSCSRALRCGDQFGSLKLVEFESELAGTVLCADPDAPQTATRCVAPPVPPGTSCDSKLTEAVFRFNRSDCQDPLPNPQGGTASCNGDASDVTTDVNVTYTGKQPDRIAVSPNSGIGEGDLFRLSATGRHDFHPNVKLLISDDDSVEQSIAIHTSCSQPLACGDVFGSLTLVGFSTKEGLEVECDPAPPGGPLFTETCEVPLAPPTPHCTSQVNSLTLVYLGEEFGSDCSVSNPQGGNASCTGDNLTKPNVSITVTKDVTKVEADPDLVMPILGLFSLVPIDPETQLQSSTEFDATDEAGNTQSVVIHTSCSQPLNLGDRFGDFAVFAIDREGDGIVSLGGLVEYQYKVTNPNGEALVDVNVDDDPFGNIVSGETLASGEMKTFFVTKTLFGSHTNTGTATAELATGGMCEPAVDTVTVDVTLPPDGPYDCTKDIQRLGMIWDGTQDVTVTAWKGAVGSTQVPYPNPATVYMPGDEVLARNFAGSPNDVVWEVFDANSGTKLGESKFHVSCSDPDMNGLEDCGKNQGDGKSNDPGLINDWLLERIKDDGGVLNCTPEATYVPPTTGCGIGFELLFVVPPILWLTRRRRSAA